MLISVDWLPPYLCPSRRLLRSRLEDRGLVTLPKIAPIPGPRLLRWLEFVINGSALRGAARCSRLSGGQRDDARDRPGEGRHLPGMATTTSLACLPRAIKNDRQQEAL